MQTSKGKLGDGDAIGGKGAQGCLILDVAAIANLAPPPQSWFDGAEVWFFGGRYADLLRLRTSIPNTASLASVGEEINAIATDLRDEFCELDAQIRTVSTPEIDILSSNLAERAPYEGALFLNCCRHKVFLGAIGKNERSVFVTDNALSARLMYKTAKRLGKKVWWNTPGGRRPLSDHFSEYVWWGRFVLRGLRTRLGGVRRLLTHLRIVRALRKKAPGYLSRLRDVDVLVVAWAKTKTFSSQTETNCVTSLGNLPQLIREEARLKVGFIALPIYWSDPFDEIAEGAAAASDPILFLEDAITPWDVLLAAWRSLFAVGKLGGRLCLQGEDYSPILRAEKRMEWLSWRPATASLFAKIGPFLRQSGIAPSAVVYVYEQQSWEKCLLLGMREKFPKTRMIACQQSAFARNYLNFWPSKRDMRNRMVPDTLLVSGERFAHVFEEHLGRVSEIRVLGSVRYAQVMQNDGGEVEQQSAERGVTVLCATSSVVQDCCELVVKVGLATRDCGVKVLVNFHPLTDAVFRQSVRDEVFACCGTLEHVEFRVASAVSLLGEVDAVFYTDTNAAFEALAKGVPVVHIQHDALLDYNQVEEPYCVVARDDSQIRGFLKKLKDGEIRRLPETMRESVLAQSFGMVRREVVTDVFEGGNERAGGRHEKV